MSFKDKIKQFADEAIAQATSDEAREKAKAAANASMARAQAFIASESGQRLINNATTVSRQLLANVARGDSLTQAAAKATKAQVRAKAPSKPSEPAPPKAEP